jgi:D-amino peptidase
MKIYIITDLEGVAGVVDLPRYCLPGPENKYGRTEGGRYYDLACELATQEVNAAIDGLLEGGAEDFLVCDGHGPGGLCPSAIHPAARILTGKGQSYPRGLDDSFDAVAIIGQHAKANTDGGHLCHSGSFSREEWLLDGRSIGEIELTMLTAGYFALPVILLSGDRAACAEARALSPDIKTVAVIEGLSKGSSAGMTTNQAIDLNVPAVHFSPQQSRDSIRRAACESLSLVGTVRPIRPQGPHTMVRITRPDEQGHQQIATVRSDDFIDLLNQSPSYQPLTDDDR